MIRSVSFCYRRASVTLLTSWLYFMNEQFSLHLDLPDCNVFGSACTDNSSFRCSPSAYLMQISWIFVCRASFRQVTASIDALQLLLFHAYYFCASICQRTILSCPFIETLVWRKIVAARTTYFIRYKDLPLRRQRGIQLLNGTKKECDWGEAQTRDPVIRNQPALFNWATQSDLGRKKLNEQTSPQSIYRCR